ncbi:CHAT domain-containing protein [Saccharothrix sp. CCNWLW140]|uniref:CHAT domain-containing protein n=1 Tax=Saccharothrix sp. CCNWLW140 TaxID=3128895 RepID=UPI00307D266D
MAARRVFISYAQESDAHREAVRDLWVFLRRHGVDAKLDWEAAQRRQDWTLWMGDQVREADVVLCVASEQYRKRAEGREGPDVGRGVQWEARLIRDAFHAAQDDLQKFVPVVLPGQSPDGIPDFLAPSTSTVYFVEGYTVHGAEKLLRFLLQQPEVVEPPLGPVPDLGQWNPDDPVPPAPVIPSKPVVGLRHAVVMRVELHEGALRTRTELAGTPLGEHEAPLPRNLRDWQRESAEGLARLGHALRDALVDDVTVRRLVELIDNGPLDHTVDLVVWLTDDVSWLPVELLRLPDHRLLATVPGVSLSRGLAGVERPATPPLAGPLKILAAVAAPAETRTANVPLDVEAEMQAVVDVVTPLDSSRAVQVRVLEVASLEEIGRALNTDQYHVLHLSAHGSADGVELEDEDGNPVFADAVRLVGALRAGARPLPLVVLSSCRGAETGSAGLAAALVRHGADRVIAMQAAVTDVFATDLARELYRVLATEPDTTVASALAAARRHAADAEIRRNKASGTSRLETVVPTLIHSGQDTALRNTTLPEAALSRATVEGTGSGVRELRIGRLIGRREQVRRAMGVLRGTPSDPNGYGTPAGAVFTGVGGIGKTAIAGRVLARAREEGWAIAEHEGVWNPAALIEAVANATTDPAHHTTAAVLHSPDRTDDDKLRAIFRLLARTRLLILFDDFEQNLTTDGAFRDEGVASIFTELCEAANKGRILVTCRYPVPDTDHLLLHLNVPPLTPAELSRLLLRLPALREQSPQNRQLIADTIGGHPRLVEFLDILLRQRPDPTTTLRHVTTKLRALARRESLDPGPGRPLNRGIDDAIRLGSRDILLDTLLTHLTAPQLELALQTSLFRATTTTQDLVHTRHGATPTDDQMLDLDRDITRLQDLTLLTTVDGELVMHPWIASSLQRDQAPADLESRHRRGAAMRHHRITTGQPRLDDYIDHIRHLASCGDYDEAADAALTACHLVDGEVTVAALLAEIVPLIPTSHRHYTWLSERECDAMQTIGLTTATAHKRHQIHELLQERLATNPDNAEYQRDLSISHDKLGDLAMARGDTGTAEQHYQASLDIAQRLATADPDNAEYQRDLSVSQNKLGDLAMARGDTGTAEQHYQASLAIRERLATADPDNTQYQRDLGVSHNKLGDLEVARGDTGTAEQHYQTSLAIAQRLAAADPDNAQYQRDLSISYDRLGDMAAARGDTGTAEQHYQADLAIAQRLAAADPDNAQYQRDLSISYERLGDLEVARGDTGTAGQHYRAGLSILERLAATDPDNAQYQRGLIFLRDRIDNLDPGAGETVA